MDKERKKKEGVRKNEEKGGESRQGEGARQGGEK